MKRELFFATLAIAALLTSCGAAFQSAAIGDDIYNAHSRTAIAQQQQIAAQQAANESARRKAQWEARLAEAQAAAAEQHYNESVIAAVAEQEYGAANLQNIVAEDYDSAYARRLAGFESPTYRMPSSYYTLRYSDAFNIASTYDTSYYNVMVSGDQIWVEPKYVTSMFGTWGASVISPYSSWYFGWSAPRYWNNWWYGYPYYGWYNYGWYDPLWGFCPPYHHHHHYPHYGGGGGHHHYRPNVVHRPSHPTIGNRPTANRYPTRVPSSGIGSSSNRNPQYRGGTVTGSGQYRGSSQRNSGTSQYRKPSSSRGTSNSNSYNSRNDNNSFRQSSTNRGNSYNSGSYGGSSYGGSYGGGGVGSGSSHGGGQQRR